jgi:hypothetical protein
MGRGNPNSIVYSIVRHVPCLAAKNYSGDCNPPPITVFVTEGVFIIPPFERWLLNATRHIVIDLPKYQEEQCSFQVKW